MLRRSDGLIVGQPAHAWVAGQLARAWGNAEFPAAAPRAPVCLAADQHDVGWAEADLAPLLGDDGRPLSFLEYPRPEHVAIWRGAARRLLAQSRYAALLVSLHGTSLYARVQPGEHAAAIDAYLRGERELQAALSAGLDADEVDRNRRLLLAWDRLSLSLCHGTATTLADVPARGGAATIEVAPAGDGGAGRLLDEAAVPADTPTAAFAVAPWPFAADRVAVGCEGRRLDGTFGSAEELRAALAAAEWVPLRFLLTPG